VKTVHWNVQIWEVRSATFIPGQVRPAASADLDRWEGTWRPYSPEFNWRQEYKLALGTPGACLYALEAGGRLQGLRRIDLELEPDEGPVSELGPRATLAQTAPWNRPPEDLHRGVGSLLLGVAVEHSRHNGHEGRLFCEPLPGSLDHYERPGMVWDDGRRCLRFEHEGAMRYLLRLRRDRLSL
jgi:hypothetical protein